MYKRIVKYINLAFSLIINALIAVQMDFINLELNVINALVPVKHVVLINKIV